MDEVHLIVKLCKNHVAFGHTTVSSCMSGHTTVSSCMSAAVTDDALPLGHP